MIDEHDLVCTTFPIRMLSNEHVRRVTVSLDESMLEDLRGYEMFDGQKRGRVCQIG